MEALVAFFFGTSVLHSFIYFGENADVLHLPSSLPHLHGVRHRV